MDDKLAKFRQLTRIEIHLFINLISFMVPNNFVKKTTEEISQGANQNFEGPYWHCPFCGYSWPIKKQVNPHPPSVCSSCKRPGFDTVLPNELHDSKCADCKILIGRKLKLLEKIQNLIK